MIRYEERKQMTNTTPALSKAAAKKLTQKLKQAKSLGQDVEQYLRHTLLDTDEYRQLLAALSPAKRLRTLIADLAECRTVDSIQIDGIDILPGRRPIDESAVETLMQSMTAIGLRTPIFVRYYPVRPDYIPAGETQDAFVLMTGAHRLEAAKRLGWESIEARVFRFGDEIDAKLWEIAENLHRKELSALDRDEQIALWVKLTAEKVAQAAPPSGGAQPKEQGQRKAAKELGIERRDVQRAVKVAGLSDEAKDAARSAGLQDNRSALLNAAKHEDAADQVAVLAKKKAEKEKAKAEKAAQQAENDRKRDEAAAALSDEIKQREQAKAKAIAARKAKPVDVEALIAEIEELREANASLEAEVTALKADNARWEAMRVQFERGGFEKVIAGKDEEIRVLQSGKEIESRDKVSWMNKAKYWKDEAIKLGWKNGDFTIDIETGEIADA